MWFLVGLLWIVSLSSRISQLAHATPLEFHHLPYRWHYPTPIVVAPSAVDYAALVVDHDAPSGREAEVKDKDKYGEDYILEEIEFSHSDIGTIGKLDYYIDEGIDYYDVDIFSASYSGEKTPPKPTRKFGSNEEHGRRIDNVELGILDGARFKDLHHSGQNSQDGRHFNTPHAIPNGYISDSRINNFERYYGHNNQDLRHFSVRDGEPDYHTIYQDKHVSTPDSRIEGINGDYGNSQGHFNTHSGSSYQTTERLILQGPHNQDGQHFNKHVGSPGYQTQYQRTEKPIADLRMLGPNNQDGQHFNKHVGSPGYETQYQRTEKPITYLRIQGPNNQGGSNVNQPVGSPECVTPHPQSEPSPVTSSKALNGGHFIYKLRRHGQELQGKLKARIENKDEIMEAVE